MHCNKSTWLCFTVSYIYSLLVLTELCLLLSQWVLVALLMWRETTGGCGPPDSVYHCFRDVCELQSKRSFRVLALVFFFLSGTGTAHLHSTNILPIALRVRNMLLVCFQLETHSHLLEILIASLKARDTQPFTALLCCGSTYSWVTAKPESFTELTAFSEKPKYCKISSSSAYLL